MNVNLETYAIGTLYRIKEAIEKSEYDKAIQLCTDGIAVIKSLSATIETNSDKVEIF